MAITRQTVLKPKFISNNAVRQQTTQIVDLDITSATSTNPANIMLIRNAPERALIQFKSSRSVTILPKISLDGTADATDSTTTGNFTSHNTTTPTIICDTENYFGYNREVGVTILIQAYPTTSGTTTISAYGKTWERMK